MKKLLFLIITILSLSLTGCVSYKELNDIGIINAIGIDVFNGEYILTLNIVTPDNKIVSHTTKSTDIDDCFNQIYKTYTKRVYLAHTDLLVLSDNISKENYKDIFNLFLNRTDSRNTFNVIVLENYNKDIFETNIENINNLLKISSEEASIITPITLDQIIKDILEMDISYIPLLRDNKKVEIIGYKTIYEDSKKLNLNDSLALNFIRNDINKTLITIDNINYQINSSKTSLSINNNNIDIKIYTEISLLDNKYNNNTYIDKYKDYIKNIIENFIENNKLNYFQNKIYKHSNDYYNKHKNFDINFNINIDISIDKNTNIKGGNPFDK